MQAGADVRDRNVSHPSTIAPSRGGIEPYTGNTAPGSAALRASAGVTEGHAPDASGTGTACTSAQSVSAYPACTSTALVLNPTTARPSTDGSTLVARTWIDATEGPSDGAGLGCGAGPDGVSAGAVTLAVALATLLDATRAGDVAEVGGVELPQPASTNAMARVNEQIAARVQNAPRRTVAPGRRDRGSVVQRFVRHLS